MPSVHTRSSPTRSERSIENQKLRHPSPDELEQFERANESLEASDLEFSDPDEGCSYFFRAGDQVYVKSKGGIWRRGQVVGQPRVGRTRGGDNLWFFVQYGKIRRYFSPLNGDIKPLTPYTSDLLRDYGCAMSE
ncbi:hypothetical protein AX16_004951 [Volvariella volvacea WC 439]|nr:hypothetical protein AX16_004951 [Volvariella volvacea WC 439]